MPKHPTGPRFARAVGLLAGIAALPLTTLSARADFDGCLAGIQAQAAAAGVWRRPSGPPRAGSATTTR